MKSRRPLDASAIGQSCVMRRPCNHHGAKAVLSSSVMKIRTEHDHRRPIARRFWRRGAAFTTWVCHYFVAENDRVVVVGATKWTNKETGKAFETPKIDIWRFRDGRAIEFFEHYDTAQILDPAKP